VDLVDDLALFSIKFAVGEAPQVRSCHEHADYPLAE
jgi:hypothetical protein